LQAPFEPGLWPAPHAGAVAAWSLELVLYSSLAFPAVRRALDRVERRALAAMLALSSLIPYLAFAPAAGALQTRAALLLVALSTALSFWPLILPPACPADAGFLVLLAGVTLAKPWKAVYAAPWEWPPMDPLGQLMWIRVGIVSALWLRKAEGVGFGWIPTRREWRIGTTHFLAFLPVGVVLGLALGLVRGIQLQQPLWRELFLATATFFGMLWVVALAEEFFFRGLLQRWATCWLGSTSGAWLLASALFGLAHLPFRGFPNWRFALLAAVAGLFYGRAYLAAGGIRAAMVAHALTNTVWRVLLE